MLLCQYTLSYKKLRSGLSAKSFLSFLLFSIVMRKIVYCISIVIGYKVENKFLTKEFLIKNVCIF